MRFSLKNSVCAATLLLLAACNAEQPQKPHLIGLANPASVSCTKQGGTLEIVSQPAGQVGMCHLPSGQTCEEWSLYRDHQCKPLPHTSTP
ncbi:MULTISPECIES: DUF333 domain-containing protein [unclassified Gluconobacter]|uniref:putative hemolysin n=1 Tax=unclassified Gluconobacter TaxID=2644261 RepID=UPI001C049631|nr:MULTISPECIES: DUF333 domain-containing protein [unclassified Gluconobacter]